MALWLSHICVCLLVHNARPVPAYDKDNLGYCKGGKALVEIFVEIKLAMVEEGMVIIGTVY